MTTQPPRHQACDLAVLNELSEQVLETLTDCLAVVIVDCDDHTVMVAPTEFVDTKWIQSPESDAAATITAIPTGRGKVQAGVAVAAFAEDSTSPVATVHLRFAHHDIDAIRADIARAERLFRCIGNYLQIANTSSRRPDPAVAPSNHVDFLAKLDELIAEQPDFGVIPTILTQTRQRTSALLVTLLCPALNQLVTSPGSRSVEPAVKTRWMRELGRLHRKAQETRRVQVTEDPRLLDTFRLDDRLGSMLISVPVLSRDPDNVASLTLLSPTPLSRADLQLLRAVCVKISGLLLRSKSYRRSGKRSQYIESIDLQIPQHRSSGLLMFDIDRMHVVNDSIGHQRGDEVIATVGQTVQRLAVDVGGQLLMTGDSGHVFIPGIDLDATHEFAERMRAKLSRITWGRELAGELTLSIGIAMLPDHADSGALAMSVAELASRSAKARGGNQVVIYQNLDNSIVQRRNDLSEVSNLQSALLNNRFVLYAQNIRPVGETAGNERYEILTRMISNDDSLLAPSKFLSAAERYQMMPAVDRWVIGQTLAQLGSADNVLEINFSTYAINIAGQTLADNQFIDFLLQAIGDSGLSPDSLCFEITESTAIRSLEHARRFIHAVQQAGCSVALDDFGAGYSSFGHLESLSFDVIKIDGRFIRNIATNALNRAIVRAVIDIARVINASTIAEYVDDDITLQLLTEMGIDYVQGFGIGQPVPLQAVIDRMDTPVSLGLTGTVTINTRGQHASL
ncbi:MAG: bifunctional diguanylate cyclase/phosphodiesterase [Pseudomonadota bacterium]